MSLRLVPGKSFDHLPSTVWDLAYESKVDDMVVLTLLKSIFPVEYANLLASKQADMVALGCTL